MNVHNETCRKCEAPIVWRGNGVPLCSEHGKERDAMLNQAQKSGRDVRAYLLSLEETDPDAFVAQLVDFCDKAPATNKRGVARVQYDWTRVAKEAVKGHREEHKNDSVPMCKEDYITYWSQTAPRYKRLSPKAAEERWSIDFQRLPKEQRESNNEDGESTGRVWILWVPLEDRKTSVDFDQKGTSHTQTMETKAPTEKRIQEYRELQESWADEMNLSSTSAAGSRPALEEVNDGRPSANNRKRNGGKGAAAPGKKGRQSVDGLEAPEVAAAKLKSATIKEVTAALDGLKRAKAKLAAEVPDPQTEGELVSPEVQLLAQRLEMLNLALEEGERSVADMKADNDILRAKMHQDPYMKAVLEESQMQSVFTIRYIHWSRRAQWPIQNSVPKIQKLADDQAAALKLLGHLVQCSSTSLSQYLTTRDALKKHQDEEEKNKKKEELRLQKLDEKNAEREKKKKDRDDTAAEKKAAKKAKAAAKAKGKRKGEEDEQDGEGQESKRRKRNSGVSLKGRTRGDFADSDPSVLKEGNQFDAAKQGKVFTDPRAFLEQCIRGEAAVLRMKKAAVKKVAGLSFPEFSENAAAGDNESSGSEDIKRFLAHLSKDVSSQAANVGAALKRLNDKDVRKVSYFNCGVDRAKALAADGVLHGCITEGQSGASAPDSWVFDRLAAIEHLTELGEEDAAKKLAGASTVGVPRGSVWSGVIPGGTPSFTYVMEGNLARSLVKLKELDALFPDASVQDKVKSFEAFGAAKAESVESLRYAYAMPGDLLFTPAACIISEKGLNSDCICLRVQALLASPNMVEDYRAMLKDFPGNKMSEFCLEMVERCCAKSRVAMTPDDAIDPPVSAEAEVDEDDEPKTSEKPAGNEAEAKEESRTPMQKAERLQVKVEVPAGTAGNDAARGIIDVEDESLEDELAKLVEEEAALSPSDAYESEGDAGGEDAKGAAASEAAQEADCEGAPAVAAAPRAPSAKVESFQDAGSKTGEVSEDTGAAGPSAAAAACVPDETNPSGATKTAEEFAATEAPSRVESKTGEVSEDTGPAALVANHDGHPAEESHGEAKAAPSPGAAASPCVTSGATKEAEEFAATEAPVGAGAAALTKNHGGHPAPAVEGEVSGGEPKGAALAAKVETFAMPAAAAVESAKKSEDSERAAEAGKAAGQSLLAAMANAKAKAGTKAKGKAKAKA